MELLWFLTNLQVPFFSILTVASSHYGVMSKDTSGLVASGYWGKYSEQESQHTVSKTDCKRAMHGIVWNGAPPARSSGNLSLCVHLVGEKWAVRLLVLTVWSGRNLITKGFLSKKEALSIGNWFWYQSFRIDRAKPLLQCTDVTVGLSARKN